MRARRRRAGAESETRVATRTTPVRKAVRGLTWLVVIMLATTALLAAGALFWKWTWLPKLGLDLQGGTEVILTPQLAGSGQVTQEELNQAVSIIRQRVDASGTSEAQINTQGSSNIVVSIPGTPDQATLNRIKSSSKLEFRPVLVTGQPTPTASSSPSAGASGTPAPTPTPSQSLSDTPTAKPTNGSDLSYVTPALQARYDAFQCADIVKSGANVAPANKPLVTCDDTGQTKYILGPVEVKGSDVTDAFSGQDQSSQGVTTGQWVVNLKFNDAGAAAQKVMTTRLISLSAPRNQFGAVLDGAVITDPRVDGVTSASSQISGSFTQESSTALANQLKFGALPIGFKVQSQDTISATLGSSQLQSGLIAGLIGLILVVIYSLFQYRLLGLVTVASLVVAAAITYGVIAVMSNYYNFRLSLSGVAGLIIAIGFTADSFIVYFERIRDELRDGRGLVGAVEAGWKRAVRTIYAAKGVNLLSAVVLYVLAVGNVQGFALTLGITTVIDVLIVILFTHPVLQLLATTRFFSSGHPLSGLDPNALGAVYRGRAQFRISTDERRAGASREAERRQTIAERKAAELESAGSRGSGAKKGGA
ncbi:MAG: protein translocase subunit SecD [Micrococcales bacterium]|nr:protein translocase subunit SecD [Micrococcales bacterium]